MSFRKMCGLAVLGCVTGTATAQLPSSDRPAQQPLRVVSPAPPVALPLNAADESTTTPPSALPDLAGATPAPRPGAPAAPTAPVPSCTPLDSVCGVTCATPCEPSNRVWMDFEWLYWGTSGQSLPPLVTAGPAGTTPGLAGVLGTPTNSILFGSERTNTDFRNGFRVTSGLWLNPTQTLGVEGDFLLLGQSRAGFSAASDGTQIVSRPFFNTLTGRPDAALVSYPGLQAGSIAVDVKNNVIGGGVNLVRGLYSDSSKRVNLLVGYRYFGVTDELAIQESLTALTPPPGAPAGFATAERFRTENHFHGGVIGLKGDWRFQRLYFGARASIAFGATQQIVDVSGATTSLSPAGPATVPGGLLVQPASIGRHERTAFAVLPEVGIRAGVQLTDYARIYGGYNFLYLSNVVRAGDQVDLRVSPGPLPTRTAVGGPPFTAHTTDFWAQGVNVGLEFQF